jgi:hypothetical protein
MTCFTGITSFLCNSIDIEARVCERLGVGSGVEERVRSCHFGRMDVPQNRCVFACQNIKIDANGPRSLSGQKRRNHGGGFSDEDH